MTHGHQGLPISPQWESDLELGSDVHNENEAAGGARDYISEVRESSLGLRFATASLGPMCCSFVLWYKMQSFVVNLQNYGSSS